MSEMLSQYLNVLYIFAGQLSTSSVSHQRLSHVLMFITLSLPTELTRLINRSSHSFIAHYVRSVFSYTFILYSTTSSTLHEITLFILSLIFCTFSYNTFLTKCTPLSLWVPPSRLTPLFTICSKSNILSWYIFCIICCVNVSLLSPSLSLTFFAPQSNLLSSCPNSLTARHYLLVIDASFSYFSSPYSCACNILLQILIKTH